MVPPHVIPPSQVLASVQRMAGFATRVLVRDLLIHSESSASGIMSVDLLNIPELSGHFPGRPILPAVKLLEAMFQVCAAGFEEKYKSTHTDISRLEISSFRQVLEDGDSALLYIEETNPMPQPLDVLVDVPDVQVTDMPSGRRSREEDGDANEQSASPEVWVRRAFRGRAFRVDSKASPYSERSSRVHRELSMEGTDPVAESLFQCSFLSGDPALRRRRGRVAVADLSAFRDEPKRGSSV